MSGRVVGRLAEAVIVRGRRPHYPPPRGPLPPRAVGADPPRRGSGRGHRPSAAPRAVPPAARRRRRRRRRRAARPGDRAVGRARYAPEHSSVVARPRPGRGCRRPREVRRLQLGLGHHRRRAAQRPAAARAPPPPRGERRRRPPGADRAQAQEAGPRGAGRRIQPGAASSRRVGRCPMPSTRASRPSPTRCGPPSHARGCQRHDLAVVGGGIIGLATAREMLRRTPDLRVVVLERESASRTPDGPRTPASPTPASTTSPGRSRPSCASRACGACTTYCDAHAIAFERCGKVIVALDRDELPGLDELEARGRAERRRRDCAARPPRAARPRAAREGSPRCTRPATGIVDFAAVARALADEVEVGARRSSSRSGVP